MKVDANESASIQRIAFIGLGLIAGSLARLIKVKQPHTQILAMDTLEVVELALQEQVIDQALDVLSDASLKGVDLIILGTHLHQSYDIMKGLAQNTTIPLTIMDLGSAKTPICELAQAMPDRICFIGGHPLAGREVSGFINSRWDLFMGKKFLLSPTPTTPPELTDRLYHWLLKLGTSPLVVEASAHDKLMALVSHFPQCYAIILAGLIRQHDPHLALSFLGGGLDDQMRLMKSPYAMWRDVFQDNKRAVVSVLDEFMGLCQQMKNDIQADNLTEWFDQSQQIYSIYNDIKSGQWQPPLKNLLETLSATETLPE